MHPQVQQAIEKMDEFLAAYPTACQYERLRDLEKKTGQPKVLFFLVAAAALTSAVCGLGGMKLMSDLFGFVYPAYMSFKAIDSVDPTDDTQWLTYWVVFALFSISETVLSFLVSWIPFYYVIKVVFFAWLYHPRFMGAGLIYKQVVKPFVMPYFQAFEQTAPQKKEE